MPYSLTQNPILSLTDRIFIQCRRERLLPPRSIKPNAGIHEELFRMAEQPAVSFLQYNLVLQNYCIRLAARIATLFIASFASSHCVRVPRQLRLLATFEGDRNQEIDWIVFFVTSVVAVVYNF